MARSYSAHQPFPLDHREGPPITGRLLVSRQRSTGRTRPVTNPPRPILDSISTDSPVQNWARLPASRKEELPAFSSSPSSAGKLPWTHSSRIRMNYQNSRLEASSLDSFIQCYQLSHQKKLPWTHHPTPFQGIRSQGPHSRWGIIPRLMRARLNIEPPPIQPVAAG